LASTVFHDPRLLTVADLEHSDTEDRWFSVGCASTAWYRPSFTFGQTAIPQQPRFG
jgi:uncharacterized DUF497 family protein